jgi:hypothetical protein
MIPLHGSDVQSADGSDPRLRASALFFHVLSKTLSRVNHATSLNCRPLPLHCQRPRDEAPAFWRLRGRTQLDVVLGVSLCSTISLQIVQHTHLLCGSLSPGHAWAGNSGRFPALGSSVAPRPQRRRSMRSRRPHKYAAKWANSLEYFSGYRRSFGVADSSSHSWLGPLLNYMDR